jgi:hypothetical protein
MVLTTTNNLCTRVHSATRGEYALGFEPWQGDNNTLPLPTSQAPTDSEYDFDFQNNIQYFNRSPWDPPFLPY